MSKTATISVTGMGNVSVPPDRTVISFEIATQDKDYSRSAGELNDRVAALRARLEESGIEGSALKTVRFDISPRHEYRGKAENRRQVFEGWCSRHFMRLELPVDRELLNKAFAAIAANEVQSSIQIGFEVSDQAALRTQVVEDATRDACRNAGAIAGAAGCKLGRALRITYGWSAIPYRSTSLMADRMMAAECSAPDIEPENVDAQDSVTIVFELQ